MSEDKMRSTFESWYCYWNGENFCSGCAKAQAAALYRTQASTLQNSAWRGITNGVKA